MKRYSPEQIAAEVFGDLIEVRFAVFRHVLFSLPSLLCSSSHWGNQYSYVPAKWTIYAGMRA